MIIELLYPDLCCLFGDRGNYIYLQECLKDAKFIKTSTNDEPYFVKHKVDLIYLGPTSESNQIVIADKLSPYVDKINELINNGTAFLLTGNALEIFGKEVKDKDGTIFKGLGILDIYATRDMIKRQNSPFLGTYEDLQIVGFQTQFTNCTTTEEKIFKKIYGIGLNNDDYVGIKKNNLIATYLVGPLLILNPLFTKRVFRLTEIPYEEALMEAYNQRVKEFNILAKK